MTDSDEQPERRYDIQFGKGVEKLLGKLDNSVSKGLVEAIETLAVEPAPSGVKPLVGHPGLLRVRVGDYRVVYTVDDEVLVVLVVHLGHRSTVYRDL